MEDYAMKRIRRIKAALTAVAVSAMLPLSANAVSNTEIVWDKQEYNSITVDGIEYVYDSNNSVVSSYASKCTEKEINIPDSIGGIPVTSFYMWNNNNVETLNIPKTINRLEIEHCYSIREYNVDKENDNYKAVDGVLYDKDMRTLILYPSAKSDETFRIPDGIENVGTDITNNDMDAFDSCDNLKNLIFPDSVKVIWSVNNCGIEYLDLPNTPFIIPQGGGFHNNKKLKEVVMPENFLGTEYGDNAFDGCDSLKTATFLRKADFKDNFYNYDGMLSATLTYPDCWNYGVLFGDSDFGRIKLNDMIIYVPDESYENYDYALGNIEHYTIKPLSEKPKGDNGDINGNDRIEVFDVLDTQNYLIGKRSAEGLDMDVNNDDTVNVIDLIVTERMVNAESE